MSTLTEQEISQFFEGLTNENFFSRIMAFDPENVDLVKACESAQEALRSSAATADVGLAIGAAKGTLLWKLSNGLSGQGSCSETGAGGFAGRDPGSGIGPGTFEMNLTITKCELHLNDGGGNPIWNGSGLQGGLSGNWSGTYA